MAECLAKRTLENQPHKVADYPSTANNLPLPLNLSMPLATCDQCGIFHLFAQCPRKSLNAPITAPVNMLS